MDEPCPRLSTASPVTPPPDAHPQDLLAPQAARPPPRFLPGRPRESPCPRRDTGGTAAAAGLTARHWFPGALIHFSDGISEVTKRRLREETAPPTPASVPPTSSFGPRPQLLLATNPDVPFTGASQGGGRGASGKISPLIGPSARQSCGAGLRRWVRRFLNMAEGEGWRVSSVGSGGPGTRVCRSERAGGRAPGPPHTPPCPPPTPPRPCEAYRAEWELCRSAGHFLRHYYVHGERPACGQWRRDLASCREWEERRSAEAQVRPGDPTGPAEPRKAGNQRRWALGAGRGGRALNRGFGRSPPRVL